MITYDDIIQNIRTIIKEKGVKQNFVANKAGFTPQEFNNILCSRQLLKTESIVNLCNALDVTPNELFLFKND